MDLFLFLEERIRKKKIKKMIPEIGPNFKLDLFPTDIRNL